MKKVLSIQDLSVSFNNDGKKNVALDHVTFDVNKGECIAIVGESGCGKTVLCKTILGLLGSTAQIETGEICLEGASLLHRSEKEMRHIRGKDISMVFQNPLTALNPSISIGKQIAESMRIHQNITKAEAMKKTLALMKDVGLKEVELRYHQRPYQFSGGMRQRVAIAIALAANPKIMLADEPTTFLDKETQGIILDLIISYGKKHGIAVVFITHDLSIVEELAERVVIMQSAKIVEAGLTEQVFHHPVHEYTKRLIHYANYGTPKSHLHGDLNIDEKVNRVPLIEIKGLSKSFQVAKKKRHSVLQNVNLEIYKGEILGVMGESGCGKSTLARCIMDIYSWDEGEINTNVEYIKGKTIWRQMIFQDSFSALNPRMKIEKIIGEALRIRDGYFPDRDEIFRLMDVVELERKLIDRYPYEISGGQRQRAAIARAISTHPEFIIADEPISSLDVSIQAQIIHLIKKLNAERGITFMLISHNLPMMMHICDRLVSLPNLQRKQINNVRNKNN